MATITPAKAPVLIAALATDAVLLKAEFEAVGTMVGFPTTGMGALVDGNDDGIEDGDGDAMGNKEGVIVGGGVVGCDVVVGIIVGCPDVGIEDSAFVG